MKNFKRIAALVLTVIMAFAMVGCTSDGIKIEKGQEYELAEQINASGKYLLKKVTAPKYLDEDTIIALNRSTYIDYWHNRSTNYVNKINHYIKNNGFVLGEGKQVYAEGYPDVILAITTCGIYANWASAGDLIHGVCHENVVMMAGPLNKVDGLIALESGKYQTTSTADLTRQDLIDYAMNMQKPDGSFAYPAMDGETTVMELTSTAVTALALTGEKGDVEVAVKSGTDYLVTNVKEDTRPVDLVKTILALNTAGMDVTNINGNNLIQWLMRYSKGDGSFSFNKDERKGNVDDTSAALLALASQYRFENDMTSVYDMSDVLGATHNQLSPAWMMNVRIMITFMFLMFIGAVTLAVRAKIRISRWKKEGRYDPVTNTRLTDAELAERKAKREREAEAIAHNLDSQDE